MIILKVGGGKKINWDYICQNIANLQEKIILVHGANWEAERITKKLGNKIRLIQSPSGYTSRYTDLETLETLTMVYSGLVNKRIVLKLQQSGLNAIGLSGIDGRLWEGKRKKVILEKKADKIVAIRDSYQGKVVKVNAKLLRLLLNNNYLPVITIPAISDENEMINVDNDRAVAIITKDLNIDKIVVLFEAKGLMKDVKKAKSLVKTININEIDNYFDYALGNMKKKLLGAKEAFDMGVKQIFWSDGRVKNPISKALQKKGTYIYAKL